MTQPPAMEPIIIEPHTEPRQADPMRGKWLLYDADFEPDTHPKSTVTTPQGATLRRPHFPHGQIAPWVFGRKPEWLRHQMRRAPLLVADQPLTWRYIKGRGNHEERRLTLADIERLAWALYERGDIDGLTLQRASQILVAVARQHLAA